MDENPWFTCYYWRQGFVSFSPSLVIDRSDNPYRRPSAGLFVSLHAPFIIETGNGDRLETQAALIAPNVLRRRIVAESSLVVFDISVLAPEFHALAPLFAGMPVRELNASTLAPLAGDFSRARHGTLDAASARNLVHQTVFNLSGRRPEPPKWHPRIAQLLQMVHEQPLHAVNLTWLAKQVNLSSSRLRHLFREQAGISLSQYLRWNAIWRAAWLWSPGKPWTTYAVAAGFHDFSHFNRTFNEIFGINPSTLSDPGRALLVRCECG
jgi:AraC-like DNA-binding protein